MVADAFIKGKMILSSPVLSAFPSFAGYYWISVCNHGRIHAMGALGVQLLIGYTGLVTLGHAAFIAVGAYTSTLLILQFPWPAVLDRLGLAYPISILAAAVLPASGACSSGFPQPRSRGST